MGLLHVSLLLVLSSHLLRGSRVLLLTVHHLKKLCPTNKNITYVK
jgi:hypothetical protein